MKRFFCIIVTLSMLFVLVAACATDSAPAAPTDAPAAAAPADTPATTAPADDTGGSEDGFRVGFSHVYVGNAWRVQYVEGIEAAFQEYIDMGVLAEFSITDADNDITTQLNQLNLMLNSGYDAIIINPVSPTALGPFIREAQERGVLIVNNNDLMAFEGVYSIGTDFTVYTQIQVDYLASKLPNQSGNLVGVTGFDGNSTVEIHLKALERKISEEFPGLNMLAMASGEWSDAGAQTTMSNFLAAFPEIDAVYTHDGMTMGIINAFRNAGRDLVPMGGDYFKAFIDFWDDNRDLESVIIANSPQAVGASGVHLAMGLLMGKTVNRDLLIPNPLDESLVNFIAMPPSCVVFRDPATEAPFMVNYPHVTVLSLDEIVDKMRGLPETAAINIPFAALSVLFDD